MSDSAPLLGREWLIEDIVGGGVIDNSPPALHLLNDGRLAGNASCNRIIGRYTSNSETLRIEAAGTSMMACPEALMNQERKLLNLLPAVTHYRIDDTGALVLSTSDGKTIVARR